MLIPFIFCSVTNPAHQIEILFEERDNTGDSLLLNEHSVYQTLQQRNASTTLRIPTVIGMGHQSNQYFTITRREQGVPLREFVQNKFFPRSMVLRFAIEVVSSVMVTGFNMSLNKNISFSAGVHTQRTP